MGHANHRKAALTSPAAPARGVNPKREVIIAAAKEMFFLEGYAGTSMDRITARAGVSKATVYSHFGSKEELLLAVVEAVVRPIKGDYRAFLDDSRDFASWLLDLGVRHCGNVLLPDVTALERLVIAEALRFPELGRIFHANAVNASLQILCPRVRQAIDEGELRPCDPMTALRHFAEMCVGDLRRNILLNGGETPDQDSIRRHVENLVDVFLFGYAARR